MCPREIGKYIPFVVDITDSGGLSIGIIGHLVMIAAYTAHDA